jgi:hypothetical protein
LSRTLVAHARIDQQRPSHGDQIHLVAHDHLDQLVDARNGRSLAANAANITVAAG